MFRSAHVSASGGIDSALVRIQEIGSERLSVFLAHPAFQDLPALLETPGAEGHGTNADEVRKLRELHVGWIG